MKFEKLSQKSKSDTSKNETKNTVESIKEKEFGAQRPKVFEALSDNSGDIKRFEVEATIPVEEGKFNWHDNFLELIAPKIKDEKILDLFCGPNSVKRYFKDRNERAEVVGLDIADERADIKADVKNIKKIIKPEKQFGAIFELGGVPGNIDYESIGDYLADNGLYITSSSDEVFYKDIEPILKNPTLKSKSFFGKNLPKQMKYFRPNSIIEIKNIKSYIANEPKNEVYIVWKKQNQR